ncbi:MAG: hypothetical protein QNI99_08360 [Woeseiaceae bacterium]|nr:hypothetical protein [Woeseiaceae bacterium]
MTLIVILLTLIAATVVHISVMAVVPAALGIRPLVVSYGLGPRLFRKGVFQIRVILLGGYVTLPDSRAGDLEPEQLADAIDRRPMWFHATVLMLPHLILLAVGSAIYGDDLFSVAKTIWTQFFLCAISPLSVAQDQLASFVSFVESSSLMVLFGWMLAILTSLAFLPVGSAAGGQLILILISQRRSPHALTERLYSWTVLAHIVLLGLWGVAIVVFVWRYLSG